MLIECALAIISLCAVAYIWNDYESGTTVTPTVVFATGISQMLDTIPFLQGTAEVDLLLCWYSPYRHSASLHSIRPPRLSRYMFQEFWLDGQTPAEATGYKKVLANPYVATIISVVLGIALGMTGYTNIWALFGAANQLLAAIGLLAVASWLGKVGGKITRCSSFRWHSCSS